MLIPLKDPIWSRLYGPYGVKDVAVALEGLSARWEKTVADTLFWERLHHQETLYPVTYAALPWLREIALRHKAARRDVLIFASWVIYCATTQEVSEGERYLGLSTDLLRHHFQWIAHEQWLTESDMGLLQKLADWMDGEIPQIARDCIAEMGVETDRRTVSHLAWAPLCQWGGRLAARAVEMFTEGEEIDVIREAMDLSDADYVALYRLAVEATGQGWLRELALLLDGREFRPEQEDLRLG